MTITIHPRAEIGAPQPPASRAKLAPARKLLVHYTGSPGYANLALKTDQQWAQGIAKFGASEGKTWEYNYLIAPGGTIYEDAGEFVGAHCLSFNPQSIGVLMIIGTDTPSVPQAMIDAFVALHSQLLADGKVDADPPVPHHHYRATSCPGPLLAATGPAWKSPTGQGTLGDLIPALLAKPITSTQNPTTPPPPVTPAPIDPQEDDDMAGMTPIYRTIVCDGKPQFIAKLDTDGWSMVIESSDAPTMALARQDPAFGATPTVWVPVWTVDASGWQSIHDAATFHVS